MLNRRVIGLAFTTSFFASILLSGTVYGASRSAVVSNVPGWAGAFFATTTFTAKWSVIKIDDRATYYWEVKNFDLTASVTNGKACNIATCESWLYAADVTFLNSAGASVGSFKNPPSYSCYGGWNSSTAKIFSRCRTLYNAPASAKKVRIHWTIGVVNGVGVSWLNAWHATTTVSLT